ncbi:BrnA antitoxin family protein [Bartonella sp. DGB2]|uniref:BrnA antitoxin family protein n=1 Tax=Bartonella sp. DGB2 TaxID=3388426 RepID=UPI0039902181
MTTIKSFKEGRGYTKEDWEDVTSPPLTDEELAHLKPAQEVLPASFFQRVEEERRKRGRPRVSVPKEAVTLRLAPDVIAHFKTCGADWRAKMSEVLTKASEE